MRCVMLDRRQLLTGVVGGLLGSLACRVAACVRSTTQASSR